MRESIDELSLSPRMMLFFYSIIEYLFYYKIYTIYDNKIVFQWLAAAQNHLISSFIPNIE